MAIQQQFQRYACLLFGKNSTKQMARNLVGVYVQIKYGDCQHALLEFCVNFAFLVTTLIGELHVPCAMLTIPVLFCYVKNANKYIAIKSLQTVHFKRAAMGGAEIFKRGAEIIKRELQPPPSTALPMPLVNFY